MAKTKALAKSSQRKKIAKPAAKPAKRQSPSAKAAMTKRKTSAALTVKRVVSTLKESAKATVNSAKLAQLIPK